MDLQAGKSRREAISLLSDDEDHENNLHWQDAYADFEQEQLMSRASRASPARHREASGRSSPGFGRPAIPEQYLQDKKDECFTQIYAVLPDICPNHLETWYIQRGGVENEDASNIANNILASIFENVEKGKPYPKREKTSQGLKRKRELTAAEEAQQIYGAPDRDDANMAYRNFAGIMLAAEFKNIPKNFITRILGTGPTRHLFDAYKAIEEAERTLLESNPKPYVPLKHTRIVPHGIYNEQNLEGTIASLELKIRGTPFDPQITDELRAAKELLAARKVAQEANGHRAAIKLAEEEELRNIKIAERDGTIKECGCCFGEHPLNRMVHCNSEGDLHWFCRACAKQTAENVIGNSKYEITCMSMDGCDANFSRDQMQEFLDERSFIALDRNESEAVLRMAGIENLASCPFCPYAAEYPPVEEDKEFRCQAPDCQKVSCRLCQLETHIPKSCEEFARENGLSIRRLIEEAMTAALVRTCNKCKTPFVKELGCNKMTCMRNGCLNVQCYVCSKSCSYDHFDDATRGGRHGNCPLFENVELRHEEEVKKAEDKAIRQVLLEHPEYTENDLRVIFSENVKSDDERRKAQGPPMPPGMPPIVRGFRPEHVLGGDIAIPNFPYPMVNRGGNVNALEAEAAAARNRIMQPLIRPIRHHARQLPWINQEILGPPAEPALDNGAPLYQYQVPVPPPELRDLENQLNMRRAGQDVGDGIFGARQFFQRLAGGRQHDNAEAHKMPEPLKPAEDAHRGRGGHILQMAANLVNRVGRRNIAPEPPVVQGPFYPMSPRERERRRAALPNLAVVNRDLANMDDDEAPSPNPAPRQKQRLF